MRKPLWYNAIAARTLRLDDLAQMSPRRHKPPIKKEKNHAWSGSFKSYSKKEAGPLSPSEPMIDATISEWFEQKHGGPPRR